MGHVGPGSAPIGASIRGVISAAGEDRLRRAERLLSEALALETGRSIPCVVLEHIPAETGDYYH